MSEWGGDEGRGCMNEEFEMHLCGMLNLYEYIILFPSLCH